MFSAELPGINGLDRARFERALAAFDQANAEDPTQRSCSASNVRASSFTPNGSRPGSSGSSRQPSEALRLAARCQHLERWKIPRSSYPEGRVGYLQWRTQLARFHADRAAEILAAAGYERALIDQVRRINLKQGLRSDPDVQTMEDALCLTFHRARVRRLRRQTRRREVDRDPAEDLEKDQRARA